MVTGKCCKCDSFKDKVVSVNPDPSNDKYERISIINSFKLKLKNSF